MQEELVTESKIKTNGSADNPVIISYRFVIINGKLLESRGVEMLL